MAEQRVWTVKQVGDYYSVKPEAVLGWIHRGELRALNVRRDQEGQRPQWRILDGDLRAFESSRSNITPRTATPRKNPRMACKEFV